MSDSMMIAYGAMRGSMMVASDPLRSWMEVKAYEDALRAQENGAAASGQGGNSSEKRPHSLPNGKEVSTSFHGNRFDMNPM